MRYSVLFAFIFISIKGKSQSYEIKTHDTINRIDIRNQKQGKWIIKGMHGFKKDHSAYKPEQIIETGVYVDNRKEGVWEEYYKNGKMRSKLSYIYGVLEGPATFYDTNGNILKEGKFKQNKWEN